jgi:hypothetical protein
LEQTTQSRLLVLYARAAVRPLAPLHFPGCLAAVMAMKEAAVAAEVMCQQRKRGAQSQARASQGWREEVRWFRKSKNAPCRTSRLEKHLQPLSCISCRPSRATHCRCWGVLGRRMAMRCRGRRNRVPTSTSCSDCSRCALRLLNRRHFSCWKRFKCLIYLMPNITRASRLQTYVSSMIHRCVSLVLHLESNA